MKCVKIVEVHKVLYTFDWNEFMTLIPARGMLGIVGLTTYAGHPGQNSRDIVSPLLFRLCHCETNWIYVGYKYISGHFFKKPHGFIGTI